MKVKMRKVGRLAYGIIALAIATAGLVPALSGTASAGQIQSRFIEMSSSTLSATNTTYHVGFNWATTGSIQGIVVDFCDNSPIIGDTTCTAPAGFTLTGSVAVSGQSSTAGGNLSTFTTAGTLNTNRTLTLSAASAVAMTSGVSSFFDITTVTNPSTANHTFYARIYTYGTTAGATGYTVANPSAGAAVVDSGGIALSTAALITVTAKVQEQLTFCVYTGANCAAGGTAVSLGDTNGVLSSAGPFVDKNTKYDIATNAASGAFIRLKSATLTSGSFTIPAIGAAAASSASGTGQFGLCTYQSAGAAITAVAPYNNANCNTTTQTAGTASTGGAGTAQFAFDTSTACGGTNDGNVTCTYGQKMASAVAGASSTGIIAYIGNIAITQQAGIYTSTSNLIATGTY